MERRSIVLSCEVRPHPDYPEDSGIRQVVGGNLTGAIVLDVLLGHDGASYGSVVKDALHTMRAEFPGGAEVTLLEGSEVKLQTVVGVVPLSDANLVKHAA